MRISSFVSLSATLLFVSVSLSTLTGCPAEPPPAWPPPPPPIELEERAAPIAVSCDASSLRRVCEQERLREVIDLAERREIHEGGPHLLKEAKAESRALDSIQARIEAAQGGVSEDELDEIHVELRRFSARLTLLANDLR